MPTANELRTAHVSDPLQCNGVPLRPFKDLSDSNLMERIAEIAEQGFCREHVKAACRELWYRIREMHGEKICHKSGMQSLDMLDATFVEVLGTVKKFFAEDGIGLERFSYRVWDRLSKGGKRAEKRRKEQTVEDWGQVVGKLRKHVPVGNELEEQELLGVLYEEIEKLEVPLREYLRLRLGEGLIDAEIARRLNVNPSKVFRWGQEVIERLRESFAKRGLAISATALVFMLIDGPFAEATEARLDRLVEATPNIVTGSELPAGTLAPAVEAILSGKTVTATASTSTWWIAASLALIGIPASIGFGIWNHNREPIPIVENVTPMAIAPETIAKEAVRAPSEVAASPIVIKPLPGNFPPNPSTGQIHSVPIGTTGVTVDLAWGTSGWWFQTEVTQGQWKAVGLIVNGVDNPSARPEGDDLPVENISPKMALEFCRRFQEITGIPVRLPTSQEWQEAAAAGLENPNATPTAEELDRKAWYRNNSGLKTQPVRQLERNVWNLFDIYGNVFEIVVKPTGDFEIRGASWSYEDFWCVPNYPSKWGEDQQSPGVGIRLVFDPNDVVAE